MGKDPFITVIPRIDKHTKYKIMNYDSYFYSLNIKYNIARLKDEVESYAFNILSNEPDHGQFKKNKSELAGSAFKYLRIKDDDINNLHYTNYLKTYLEDNLDIKLNQNISITCTEPFKKTLAHIDGSYDYCDPFAINFPLFKVDKGFTQFWEIKNESDILQRQLGSKWHKENNKSVVNVFDTKSKAAEKIVDVKMDSVKIINTAKYHSVDNSNNSEYRMNLSFRTHFKDQLTWHEILKRAKEVTWE